MDILSIKDQKKLRYKRSIVVESQYTSGTQRKMYSEHSSLIYYITNNGKNKNVKIVRNREINFRIVFLVKEKKDLQKNKRFFSTPQTYGRE